MTIINNLKQYAVHIPVLTAVVLWSSAFVGVRAGLHHYHPGSLALLRYSISSLLIWLVLLWRPTLQRTPWQSRLGAFLLGMVGIGLYSFSINTGETIIPAGMASFIVSQSPILVAVLAVIFLGERLSWRHILALSLCTAGMICMTMQDFNELTFERGVFFMLLATIASAIFTVSAKKVLQHMSSLEFTAYAIWGGTATFLFYIPTLGQDIMHATWQSTVLIIYLGVFPATIAYICWSYAISKFPVSKLTMALYTIPVITTLFGIAFLHEVPTRLELFGGSLALLGAILV